MQDHKQPSKSTPACYIKQVEDCFDGLCNIFGSNADVSWAAEKTIEYATALFSHSPIQVNDLVLLVKPIDFEQASGWKGSECFLIPKVACGTVVDLDWRYGHFTVGVKWFAQSYMAASWRGEKPELKKIKPSNYGIYYHNVSDVRKIQYPLTARLDLESGAECWCGEFSEYENGWCGKCNVLENIEAAGIERASAKVD